MTDTTCKAAVLPHLSGIQLPALSLSVSAQFQFCVDAGAASAVCFFDDMTSVGLHDHVALSMHAFVASFDAGAPIDVFGQLLRTSRQACIDAFAAGYLGRIQQELRLFKVKPGAVHSESMNNRRRSAH